MLWISIDNTGRAICYIVIYEVLQSDPFEVVKWPFGGVRDRDFLVEHNYRNRFRFHEHPTLSCSDSMNILYILSCSDSMNIQYSILSCSDSTNILYCYLIDNVQYIGYHRVISGGSWGGPSRHQSSRRGPDARIALSTFVRLVNDAWYGIIGTSMAIGTMGILMVLNGFKIYGRDHNELWNVMLMGYLMLYLTWIWRVV